MSCVMSCGCGGPTISKVAGTVTYKGKPLEFGKVFFAPMDQTIPPAQSVIQSDGTYSLEVQGDRKAPIAGAYAGEYRVWISCYPYHKPGWAGNPLAQSKSLIPEKYENVNTSGLTASVGKGPNTFDFALE